MHARCGRLIHGYAAGFRLKPTPSPSSKACGAKTLDAIKITGTRPAKPSHLKRSCQIFALNSGTSEGGQNEAARGREIELDEEVLSCTFGVRTVAAVSGRR